MTDAPDRKMPTLQRGISPAIAQALHQMDSQVAGFLGACGLGADDRLRAAMMASMLLSHGLKIFRRLGMDRTEILGAIEHQLTRETPGILLLVPADIDIAQVKEDPPSIDPSKLS